MFIYDKWIYDIIFIFNLTHCLLFELFVMRNGEINIDILEI